MKHGNWAPISKAIVSYLPKIETYDKVHALVSVQVSIDNKSHVSITGLSRSWKWSQNKVRKFLKDIGAEIVYDQNTKNKQNQKGVIKGVIMEGSVEKKGVIRVIINKDICIQKEGSQEKKGVKKEGSMEAINDPNNINDPNPKTKRPKSSNKIAKPKNVTEQTWNDFLTHRKSLKAPITQTVLNSFYKQSQLAGMTLEDALIESISRGWRGFKAEWVKNKSIRKKTADGFIDDTPDFLKPNLKSLELKKGIDYE